MSSGDVRSEATRRANLIEVLQDAHESCPEIPEEAAALWSEEAIRRWFTTNGAERPADASAAMAALDVDGTPLPPSTRPDGMYLCQRIGCDAVYAPTDEGNPEGCCRHHAGPPVFHDGTKSWSCCGAKSHDFGEFMSLPGCAVGRHTQKKPPKPAPSPNNVPATSAPVPVPVPVTTTNVSTTAAGSPADTDADDAKARCARCRQGFFCSDHAASAEAQASYVPPPPPKRAPAPPTGPADPDAPQICRNKGCGERFTEAENSDDACAYHPGPPIFHERQKGWSCCDKICYDFDEFMRIPPCTRGRHDANPDGGGVAEYAKRTQK